MLGGGGSVTSGFEIRLSAILARRFRFVAEKKAVIAGCRRWLVDGGGGSKPWLRQRSHRKISDATPPRSHEPSRAQLATPSWSRPSITGAFALPPPDPPSPLLQPQSPTI
ncbi:hypothetical protein CASFOL_022050 [Castilleja foliolosa]|uniref:Uncharacterized protein n=1 Tax=Castilleja foliolosa TaxID=1961234 RepID=A0ABD3D2B3_9LAMI